MPPLDKRLRDVDDPGDESAVHGIVAALFLVLPAVVRQTAPADLLRANGYSFLAALETLTVDDLESLGVLRGHAAQMMRALRPAHSSHYDQPQNAQNTTAAANVTAPAPQHRVRCRPFPEVLTARSWKAFVLAFVVVLQMMGYPIPVPDAVLAAALRPSEPSIALGAESSEQIWNALLSVEGGLPDDILLGIPSDVIAAKDGEAAVRHIGRVVMTSSDQSIGVLSAWYNDPTPVTKPTAVSDALNEWIRVGEQLTAEGASPTPVQRRISLAALFGRIPDISRAFDALQAVADVMDVDDMIKQVRRIGDRNTSLASQKRAIAMMSAAASDSFGDVSGEEARRGRKARAMAASGKRQKTGRCKF